ncbi:serine/threonine-protein kinase [Geodermatophilus bullaregiensis]|uniref:serine/threonine protein kinase n=1 Tax=Geodermatophilus bullaregiensis TaxID=1564160 RepID=UPI0019595A21|nr:serine/threonine-protein kinase [Geodermatophilus bullaregiensis]MBM7807776.1 serine/threonine-protein kinase [Geodermatophilus bullaregiensis]
MAVPENGRIGRYHVREELGSGGGGAVYRAWDPVLDRDVAIKVCHELAAGDATVRQRFADEVKNLARLNHPAIVTVFEYESRGVPWFAMEFIEGPNLDAELGAARGPLPVPRALALARQLSGAIDYLHQVGIVHRDVKPMNVLLRRLEHGRESLVLSDLGISKDLAYQHRLTTHPIGTWEYAAPEQLDIKAPVTPRIDVYAFAAVVFEMLTGRRPFIGDDWATLIATKLRNDFPQAHVLRPELPAGMDGVLRQAMSDDPNQRPETCQEVTERLEAVLARTSAATSGAGHANFAGPTQAQSYGAGSTYGAGMNPPPPVTGVAGHPRQERPEPASRNGLRARGLLAGILTVIGALYVGIQLGSPNNPSETGAPEVTSSAPAASGASSSDTGPPSSAPAPASSSTSASVSAGPPTIRHQGDVQLARNGDSIDINAPSNDPTWRVGQLDLSDTGAVSLDAGNLYVWDASGTLLGPGEIGSYEVCSTQTTYTKVFPGRSVNELDGRDFCIRTAEGRFATIRLVDYTDETATLSITVWELADR